MTAPGRRIVAGPASRTCNDMNWAELPDGAFVVLDQCPLVVVGDHLALWDDEANAYVQRIGRPRSGTASVITPPPNSRSAANGIPHPA